MTDSEIIALLAEALERIEREEGRGESPAPVIVARVRAYAAEALAQYEETQK